MESVPCQRSSFPCWCVVGRDSCGMLEQPLLRLEIFPNHPGNLSSYTILFSGSWHSFCPPHAKCVGAPCLSPTAKRCQCRWGQEEGCQEVHELMHYDLWGLLTFLLLSLPVSPCVQI